jgi:hypothetical protein
VGLLTPVAVGLSYTATWQARAATVGRSLGIYIQWFDVSATFISQDYNFGPPPTDNTTAWTPLTVTATAPVRAVYADVLAYVGDSPAAGEVHYFDRISLTLSNGDLDLRAKVSTTSLDSVAQNIFNKGPGTSQAAYGCYLASGFMVLRLSADGSALAYDSVANVVPFSVNQVVWVRVTWRQSDKRTQYFTSPDGGTWTQFGIDGSVNVASIFDGTSPLEVGGAAFGETFSGDIYYAEVRNGIDGPVVASFAPAEVTITSAVAPTTWINPTTGETWTINGTVWNWILGTLPEIRVSFPLPPAALVTGANLQEFRVRVQPG